ncbi:nitroreductase [Flexivirga sp. ID2601S]|uniref:Nitroreductase n=1 Tax=Flexivirga aerilata TaxID=1656889 RepID=A0A849AE51_9MICO|nr:nitroreductase family protein [Flexivirga aerilata]NNG38187.1 nitroreductase [Flexivirga aerilata]
MAQMTIPQIDPLLRDRRSPSVFDPAHTLDDAALAALLEAARWSPSWGNTQPWRFLVGRRGDATHQRIVAALSRGNAQWVPAASAILIGLRQVGAEPDDPKGGLRTYDYTAYDLGQSAAHLCVQAVSMGLSVHQFGGFDHDAVAASFAVPAEWQVLSGIAVGRWLPPAERTDVDPANVEREERPRKRRPLDRLAFAGQFGDPLRLELPE